MGKSRSLPPVVRYMIVCEGVISDPTDSSRASILNLITSIRPSGTPAYPTRFHDLCVFLALTGCRGAGEGYIACVSEEDGSPIFRTPAREIALGSDPLEVFGVPFRVLSCPFPHAGLYSIQFWFDKALIQERPVLLR